MVIKTSTSLIAILAIVAFPAFAQDATEPSTDAPAETVTPLEQVGQDIEDQMQDAAGEAEAAAKEAADAMTETTTEAPEGAAEPAATPTTEGEAAADEAAAAADESGMADSSDAKPSATDAPAATEAPATASPADAEPSEGAADTSDAAAAETPAPGTTATPSEQAAEEASGEPKVGTYYAKSTHSDWTIRCLKTDTDADPCELYQLMNDSEGNSVAEMMLIPLENGQVSAGATMIVPLETDLTRGLSLAIDSGKANAYPFSFCTPVGCVSRMGFTAGELNALRAGSKATVSLLPFGADPANPVELELSLSGFTAGYDELSKLAAATRDATDAQPAEDAAPAE